MRAALAAAMLAVLANSANSAAPAAASAASAATASAGASVAAPKAPLPPVPLASDLRRDGLHAARIGMPLVLFFSLPDCRYCHTVRHNYLAPMLGGAHIIREIEIGGSLAAAGLDGAATNHAGLAQRFAVRFAPTVLFVGPAGEAVAPPLLGGDTAGMYGALLDARLATARQAAAAASASAASATSAPKRTAP